MDSPLARYLAAHDLGTLHEQIALKEPLALPGGGVAPAWLCTTGCGVFIAGVAGEPGAVIDLGRAADLRFQWRPMGDRVTVSGQTFTLPIGSGDRVRVLIARARLTVAAPHPVRPPASAGPFIQPGGELETSTGVLDEPPHVRGTLGHAHQPLLQTGVIEQLLDHFHRTLVVGDHQ